MNAPIKKKRYLRASVFLGLFFLIGWLGWGQHYAVTQRAISVVGTLFEADRHSSTIKSGGGKVSLLFEYDIDGKKYRGSQVIFGGDLVGNSASSNHRIQSEVDRLSREIDARKVALIKDGNRDAANKVSLSVPIWVDSRQPSNSALILDVHPALKGITSFFCVALLIGVIRPFVR